MPKLAGFLMRKRWMSFFPDDALNFFTTVSEEIIRRRRLKEEV